MFCNWAKYNISTLSIFWEIFCEKNVPFRANHLQLSHSSTQTALLKMQEAYSHLLKKGGSKVGSKDGRCWRREKTLYVSNFSNNHFITLYLVNRLPLKIESDSNIAEKMLVSGSYQLTLSNCFRTTELSQEQVLLQSMTLGKFSARIPERWHFSNQRL